MKGVILAGGLGTRLAPLTLITNKHLLPIYDKPMILYPLDTLKRSGIDQIMIVCGKEHGGHFMNFLGSGKEYGVKLSYALQHGSGGIADALNLAKEFVNGDKVAVILGDNIFENDFSGSISGFEANTTGGAMVFLKKVPDPWRFGVAEVLNGKIKNIIEKPKEPKSDLATVGFYIYDSTVFEKIGRLAPSSRNELEITDVHNMYIQENKLYYDEVGGYWSDAGTFDSLYRTAGWAAEKRGQNK
jgi:glucose-1-phosphate thymidylyltransferase